MKSVIIKSIKFTQECDFLEKEREGKQNPVYADFMCLGLSVGMAIGAASDNMPIGMCLGMSIGMCLGTALDAQNRKKDKESEKDT